MRHKRGESGCFAVEIGFVEDETIEPKSYKLLG